jgi:N4-gp56 family major capsid protein
MSDPILPNATLYSDVVSANSDLKGIIWAKKVIKSTNERFVFKHFLGEEGSKLPIIKKQDLAVGAAQKVTFITVAPLRGHGTLGENTLETATEKVLNGSFGVNVDYLAHAVSWTQSFAKIGPAGRNIDQWSSDALGDWWARRSDDDPQIKMREAARLTYPGTNLYRIGGRVSDATMLSTDTLTTTEIEATKGILISHAADEIGMDVDANGVDVPKFIYFAPDQFLRRLRSSTTFLTSLQFAGLRGQGNELFSGKYPMWDNNVMFAHNVKTDDADGRQGSPLYPMAYLGTAITSACTTTIVGGGHLASGIASGTGDYFANFPGFQWKIYDAETLPTDVGNTYYAMIYNHTTDGKYEIFSYQAANVAATGYQITSVTRGTNGNFNGNVLADTATGGSRFSQQHPRGAIIIPCTINGVLLTWGLHMGAQSLFHAVGSTEVERLVKKGGFENDKGEQRVVGYGIQGVRGMEPFVDARAFPKNYLLIQGAGKYAGVSPVAYTG